MYERLVAGAFAGAGALLLIYKGYIVEGSIILTMMVSFFVGEHNGQRKAENKAATDN